jgi:hypothetical protein
MRCVVDGAIGILGLAGVSETIEVYESDTVPWGILAVNHLLSAQIMALVLIYLTLIGS